ncbi:hypothetical protein ES706_05435 [subsurface metagenome]
MKRLIIILIAFSLLVTGAIYLVLTKRDKRLRGVRKAAKFSSIQAALDDLPDSGGKVFVPAGTYTISKTIFLKNNQTLTGAGPSSIITTNVDNLILIHCKDISIGEQGGAVISNLQLLGKGTNPGPGIVVENCHNVLIQNVRIIKTSYGIEFVATVSPSQHTDNNWIVNCYFGYTTSYGIYFHPELSPRAECNVIQGNIFIRTGRTAIYIYPGKNNLIVGNQIEAAGAYGIFLRRGLRNTVTGNVVFASTKHGIYFRGQEGSVISSNTCYANDYGGTGSYDGICLRFNADRNTIIGNTCFNNGRYGISIYSNDCDRNIILGNVANDNGVGQIIDNGTNTDKDHN